MCWLGYFDPFFDHIFQHVVILSFKYPHFVKNSLFWMQNVVNFESLIVTWFDSYNLLNIFRLITMRFISSIFLPVVESWNRHHHGQTIHSKEKLISMNSFKKICVVIWAWLFLTSTVMEAVRGQKCYRELTLFAQRSVHPIVPVLLTKINKK